jgi:DNA-binding transcriptional MerR regulator
MSDLIESPVLTQKSAAAFKTISEVATETGVPQHVLRFWEGKFTQLRPLKRGGGRRYYRPEDVSLLLRIRRLLQEEGYTIKGVQKVLRDHRAADDVAPQAPKVIRPAPDAFPRTRAAVAAQSSQETRRLVLGVEQLDKPLPRERLIQDVLMDLRDIRDTLKN